MTALENMPIQQRLACGGTCAGSELALPQIAVSQQSLITTVHVSVWRDEPMLVTML